MVLSAPLHRPHRHAIVSPVPRTGKDALMTLLLSRTDVSRLLTMKEPSRPSKTRFVSLPEAP